MLEGFKRERTRTEDIILLTLKPQNSHTTAFLFVPTVKGRSGKIKEKLMQLRGNVCVCLLLMHIMDFLSACLSALSCASEWEPCSPVYFPLLSGVNCTLVEGVLCPIVWSSIQIIGSSIDPGVMLLVTDFSTTCHIVLISVIQQIFYPPYNPLIQ